MLDQQINQAFLDAYKSKDEQKVSTLRMLKSAILNKKIEKRLAKEEILPDADAIVVLKSELKKRQDSIESYKAGGRTDLADKEGVEAAIIKAFLPSQMSEDQALEIVKAIIAEQGNPGPAGFGKIMGAVMAKAQGQVDGNMVSRLVKEEFEK